MSRSLTRLFPGLASRLVSSTVGPARLPFPWDDATLLGFGSCATVFLTRSNTVTTAAPPLVLKVYRKSLGKPLDEVVAVAQRRRAEYELVDRWYRDCPVVLPTSFMVLHGPVLSVPAAACVQPFQPRPHVDVLADLPRTELLHRLSVYPQLREQFLRFVECTWSAADSGACVDLLGRNNLVIVYDASGPRLVVLDCDIIDFARARLRAPYVLPFIRSRLEYLRDIYDETSV